MCMAIPSKVVALGDGTTAVIESFGLLRAVNIMLLDEPVAIGDYLLVRAGGYAYEKLDEERALDALAALAEADARMAAKGTP